MTKKLIVIALLFVGLGSLAQPYRIIDWKFKVENVEYVDDSTWIVDAIPYDYNDPGADVRAVGNYVRDYINKTFEVIDYTATTLTLRDVYYNGIPTAPQQDQTARCYLSLNGGDKLFGSAGATNDFQANLSTQWLAQAENDEWLAQAVVAPKDSIIFTLDHQPIQWGEGVVYYDTTKRALTYFTDIPGVFVHMGQELLFRVYNGNPFTITNGTVVTPDVNTVITLADNRLESTSRILAVATHGIPPFSEGWATKSGQVGGLNTSMYQVGQELYLGHDGQFTAIRPTGGEFENIVAIVDVVDVTNGIVTVDISISLRTAEQNQYTGWPDSDGNSFPDNVGITLDSVNRYFILTPFPASEFYYYHRGEKYLISEPDTFQWSDAEGIHLIYKDGLVTKEIVNPTDAQSADILQRYPGIGNVYWSQAQNDYIFVNNEFHSFDMNGQTKAVFYDIHGAVVIEPIALVDFDIDLVGNLASNAQFGNSSGSMRNEDIKTFVPATASTFGYTVFYREGVSAWRSTFNPGFGVVNTGTGRVAFNENVGGIYQLTEATNGSYVPYYLLVSNTLGRKYGMVPGNGQYANEEDAVAGAINNLGGFLQNMPIREIAPLAIIVFQTRDNYTNAVKARVVQVTDPNTGSTVDYIDLTARNVIGGSGSTGMQTLTDDPNGQPTYAGFGTEFITVNASEDGWEFTARSDIFLTEFSSVGFTVTQNQVIGLTDSLNFIDARILQNETDIGALQSASHPALSKIGTGTYGSLDALNQILTLNKIDLANTDHITGVLADANVANNITLDNITQVTNRAHSNLTGLDYASSGHTGFEPALTKGNLTETITGLQFSATRQVIGGATVLSLTPGYVIPTTLEQTNWNSAYSLSHPAATLSSDDTQILSLSGQLFTFNSSNLAKLDTDLSGTSGYFPYWNNGLNATSTIYTDGNYISVNGIAIGATSPAPFTISSGTHMLDFYEVDATANSRRWRILSEAGDLFFSTRDDAGNLQNSAIKFYRNGIVESNIIKATAYMLSDELTNVTGQQLVLNAGESSTVATGQTSEQIYMNAEGGIVINSSPDNWATGWTTRNVAIINNSLGNSSFPGDVTAPTFIGDLTGNASTATTLQTSRTIWGQSFDGSGNVSGGLSGATTGSFAGTVSTRDLYFNNYALIASDGDGAFGDRTGVNIDHIWHDEANNIWHFVSDGTYKQVGNASVQATTFIGNLTGSADLLDNLNSTQFLRTDANTATNSGIKTWFGGSIPSQDGSGAAIQVNGFLRTGNIYIHEGGLTPTSSGLPLSNTAGVLEWNGFKIWHEGNDGIGSGLNADYLDGISSGGFMEQYNTALDAVDLNTIFATGSYRVNSNCTNIPSARFYSMVVVGNESNVTSQRITDFITGETYIRAYNTSWSAWRKVWDDSNFTPSDYALADIDLDYVMNNGGSTDNQMFITSGLLNISGNGLSTVPTLLLSAGTSTGGFSRSYINMLNSSGTGWHIRHYSDNGNAFSLYPYTNNVLGSEVFRLLPSGNLTISGSTTVVGNTSINNLYATTNPSDGYQVTGTGSTNGQILLRTLTTNRTLDIYTTSTPEAGIVYNAAYTNSGAAISHIFQIAGNEVLRLDNNLHVYVTNDLLIGSDIDMNQDTYIRFGGNEVLRQNNVGNTVLSSENATLFLRPNGSFDGTGGTTITAGGLLTHDGIITADELQVLGTNIDNIYTKQQIGIDWTAGIVGNYTGFNSTIVNAPTALTYFGFLATLQGNNNYGGAVAMRNNKIYFQTRENGTLQGWQELYHTGNFTNNSTNWNTAYDDKINSIGVSGTTTKTVTLTQQDAGTVFTTFSLANAPTAVTTTLNYATSSNATRTLSSSSSITITNLPDGGEGSIEITNPSTYTCSILGSTGYTTTQKMGINTNVMTNGHTTIVYWREGSTLYYGYIHEN